MGRIRMWGPFVVLLAIACGAVLTGPASAEQRRSGTEAEEAQEGAAQEEGRGGRGGRSGQGWLEVSYCPGHAHHASLTASAASTSEKGWPPKQCLKIDKGAAGERHTIVGDQGVHNWLLGGYGNDTIIGGNIGDVIWADYQPSGYPKHQTATIHAGNGRNVIYANDTVNYVWTGSDPRTIVHAHGSGISGVIHCGSSQQVMFLSTVSEKHFKLDGCGRISHYSVGY